MREESLAILVSSLVDRALREMLRLTIVSVRSTQPSSFAEGSDIVVRIPFQVEGKHGSFVLFGTEEFFEVAARQRRREVSSALRRGTIRDAAIALARSLATRLHLELALRGIELSCDEPDASGVPLQVARSMRPMSFGGAMTLLYACQGNLLTGPEVIDKMVESFEGSKGKLAWRLMDALKAGDDAGGDKRGKQSAALLVVKERGGPNGTSDRLYDFRVDDHKDPVPELARILALRLARPKK